MTDLGLRCRFPSLSLPFALGFICKHVPKSLGQIFVRLRKSPYLWRKRKEVTMKITQDNFDALYVDPIEQQQIDHFICREMARQIHRYIKAMSGSKQIMLKFEEQLATLTDADKERAIARYIDLNRKAINGLDFKQVLVRAVANYCDTYGYMLKMVNDKRRMIYYYLRMKQKYLQFHEVFEENGLFGMRDHEGKVIIAPNYQFLRTCYVYVDDLRTLPVIAQKDGRMGLILPDGQETVVSPFVYDDIALRDEYPYFEAYKGRKKYLIGKEGKVVA